MSASPLPRLPPETEAALADAAAAAALWPPHRPAGPVRRERLTIARRPDGPSVVEWVLYSHTRIRQGFGFSGPAHPAADRSAKPGIFDDLPPPSAGPDADAGVLVRDPVLRLWLPRAGTPILRRVSGAALGDLGIVGHPDLDGPGGASGACAHAFTLAARAAARRLPDGLHPLLPKDEDSAHLRLAATEATALLPDAARAALAWKIAHRDAEWRPAFLVADRAAVLLMTRDGRTARHLASAALRRG